jgi:hypothetical protein
MLPEHEIDYEALIDRSIKDFRPVKRLWSIGARLACWILLEGIALGLAAWIPGWDGLRQLAHDSHLMFAVGLFLSASIGAAFIGLRSAIPGRQASWPQLILVIVVICVGFAIGLKIPAGMGSGAILGGAPSATLQIFAFAAPAWLCLFWAIRRGVPLAPAKSGVAVGLAASCFAVVAHILIFGLNAAAELVLHSVLSTSLITILSARAGAIWLDRIGQWQQERAAGEPPIQRTIFQGQMLFPIALCASIAAAILVVKVPSRPFTHVADFDLAIESYNRAFIGFSPNVPSTSMETMLTAYVEHGMPAYMWDFGPEGFKLMGGRWDPLPDGTPVTYTWFRGKQDGVMCMFRQTDTFNPPPLVHDDRHHLLFYRYRGFSFCLINVGGYGNFMSVITAPMPLKQFEHLVLAATL